MMLIALGILGVVVMACFAYVEYLVNRIEELQEIVWRLDADVERLKNGQQQLEAREIETNNIHIIHQYDDSKGPKYGPW